MRLKLGAGYLTALCLALTALVSACTTPASRSIAPGISAGGSLVHAGAGDIVQDKNFYLLTLLQSEPVRAVIASDTELSELGRRTAAALDKAFGGCDGSTRCVVEVMRMSDADIAIAGHRLAALASPNNALGALVREKMRPSGRYQKYAMLDDAAMIEMAWLEAAAGVNRLYRVYGLGEAPRYPAIDAISHEAESAGYRSLVKAVVETQVDGARPTDLFFESWLRVGLDLLVINQRDEAARYEPMRMGVNAASFSHAASIDWSGAPYVAILVPGAGTLPGEVGLSAAGALRIRLAARRYADGLAPFIIVSGGHVHPNKTPYAEAIEMKRELMKRYGVPEHAIVVDPHARHTTTNLRNGVRLIHAMGAPETGSVLVTTSRDQSAYIESQVFSKRNQDELGYQPLTLLRRVSPHDLAMVQNLLSLHADPADPLDP